MNLPQKPLNYTLEQRIGITVHSVMKSFICGLNALY